MGKKYIAEGALKVVFIHFEFEDNGVDDLKDQAIEAMMDEVSVFGDAGTETDYVSFTEKGE